MGGQKNQELRKVTSGMLWKRETGIDGNRIAIKDDQGKEVSYGELWKQADLLKSVIPGRTVIFIICDNSLETYSFYFQAICIDCVPLLLPSTINQDSFNHLVKVYEPGFIWGAGDLPIDLSIFPCVSEYNKYGIYKTGYAPYKIHEDLCLLLMTSGTTGNSNVVRLAYKNVETSAKTAIDTFSITEEDTVITSLAMNFAYAVYIIDMHWAAGAKIVVTNHPIISKGFWDCYFNEKITNISGTAYTFKMLKLCGFLEKEHPSLRFMSQGGDKIPPELMLEFVQRLSRVDFYLMYGQTEAKGAVSGIRCRDAKELKSVIQPLNGNKAELINVNNEGIGELVIHGDCICMGYANSKEDLNAGDIFHSQFCTGDLAKMDSEGRIYLAGRKSRFLKMLGKRVNLDDVQEQMQRYQPDMECACTGVDDHMSLFYTNPSLDGEELTRHIGHFLHINSKLIHACYIDKLPRTSSDKIDYEKLKIIEDN